MFPVYYHNFAYITRFHLKFDCFLLFIAINILQNDQNCNQSLKRHKTKQKIIVTRRYSSLSLNNVMWMTCFSGWPALIKKRRWQYIKNIIQHYFENTNVTIVMHQSRGSRWQGRHHASPVGCPPRRLTVFTARSDEANNHGSARCTHTLTRERRMDLSCVLVFWKHTKCCKFI